MQAYLDFEEKTCEQNGKTVESKIFDNDFFKYRKVTVERPLLGEDGKPVLKKGKPQPDTKLRDTETIAWSEDVQAYMEKNVYPFAPDAWIDESKTKIGYEIPFTRQFYKYVPPRSSEEIFEELKALGAEEEQLMKEILGE